MSEYKNAAPACHARFYHRMMRSLAYAFAIMSLSLFMGTSGYHYFENLPWVDALLNASMILGGMGPVDPMRTVAGKLFASFYALYSGLVLVGLIAIILAPVFRHVLHEFHAEVKS